MGMTESLKRASWLELFYDLAFVALVAQLTYLAADNYGGLNDWLTIFIVGYAIFIAWWGTTANRNLQDSETATDKLLIQLQMVGAFLMSVSMPGIFEGNVGLFTASFALVRCLQILMIFRLYRLYPERKPNTQNILQGISIATVLWVAAGFTPAPYGFIVAGAAVVLDVLTPLTRGKGNTVRLLNMSHLQERLGLFLMLVIGESMLVVALANTAVTTDLTRPAFILSGLFLMIAVWWMYYYHLEQRAEGVRPKNLFLYLQAHGWLFGSIILLAAGYKNTIKHGTVEFPDFIFITLGVIGLLTTLTVIRNALHGQLRALTRTAAIGVVLLMGLAYLAHQKEWYTEIAGVYTLLLVVVALFDAKQWHRLETKDQGENVGSPEG